MPNDRTRLPLPEPTPGCWWDKEAIDAMHAYSDSENASLLKQLNAAKLIIKGQDERSFHREREQKALILRANDVEGERAANAILTDENAALREQVRALREALEQITRHFTKAQSTLADTEMRGMAHRVLKDTK